jgi:hypothetical protein
MYHVSCVWQLADHFHRPLLEKYFRLVHAPVIDLGCLSLYNYPLNSQDPHLVESASRAVSTWTRSNIITMDAEHAPNNAHFLSRVYARAVVAFAHNPRSGRALFQRSRIWNIRRYQAPSLFSRNGEYFLHNLVSFVEGTSIGFISHGIMFAEYVHVFTCRRPTLILTLACMADLLSTRDSHLTRASCVTFPSDYAPQYASCAPMHYVARFMI